MRDLVERAYFGACLGLGRLLRAARYSTVRIDRDDDGELRVRKRRRGYAPLLVWLGGPLVRVLDTGVRVLPQRDWEDRERRVHALLHGASIRVVGDVLVLPRLPGETLATLLDDHALHASVRTRAIERAVVALAELHRRGLTHGDAMAENVMVDLDAGVARWFDFETVHDARRAMVWRRADDVRALLATCLLRTAPEHRAATLGLILDVYADEEVARVLAASFASVLRRPLAFQLGQAGLSVRCFRDVARLLDARVGGRPGGVTPA